MFSTSRFTCYFIKHFDWETFLDANVFNIFSSAYWIKHLFIKLGMNVTANFVYHLFVFFSMFKSKTIDNHKRNQEDKKE